MAASASSFLPDNFSVIHDRFKKSCDRAIEYAILNPHDSLDEAIRICDWGVPEFSQPTSGNAVITTHLISQGGWERVVLVRFMCDPESSEEITINSSSRLAERRRGAFSEIIRLVGGGKIEIDLEGGNTICLHEPEQETRIEGNRHYTLRVRPSEGHLVLYVRSTLTRRSADSRANR